MIEASKIKDLSLGKKIRQIRIDKKITQQELVGDFITRNMLSQIENDIATPSIKTLQYIAEHLEVPLSFLMVGAHDEEYNKNYEYDEVETIRMKSKQIFFDGDYLKYIEIAESNPAIAEGSKETSMFLGLAYAEAATEFFNSGKKDECAKYFAKAERCARAMGESAAAKQLRQRAELYSFMCQPILTEGGDEYKTFKPGGINSDNLINRTFDENGVCRLNITAAHRALAKNEPQDALKYLTDAETFVENYERHPYKKDIYKLFEAAYLKTEDYKNAHLYSSKILGLYSETK